MEKRKKRFIEKDLEIRKSRRTNVLEPGELQSRKVDSHFLSKESKKKINKFSQDCDF